MVFNGEVKEDGTVIEGTYSETLNDYTAVPVVSTGDFLVARRVGQNFQGEPQLLLQVHPTEIQLNSTAMVTATLFDGLGQPVANSAITFSTTLGQLEAATVSTNAGGVAVTTLSANASGIGTISATAPNVTNSRAIEITGNLSPQAVDDIASTGLGTDIIIDVLANDSDPDGSLNPSTVTIITEPSNGSTAINATSGAITYTPHSGFSGTDTFGYRVKDNEGRESNTATVTVTVKDGSSSTHSVYLPAVLK